MIRISSYAGLTRWISLSPLVLLTVLGGCGGGDSGVISTPIAPAAPAPTPTATSTPPTPTATLIPAESFRTAEYNRSDGPAFHSAIPAWQTGANGQGVTLGIVDTGIDTASPEFAGRIAAASRDVAGSRGMSGSDNHGTQVALIAGAARNDSGIMGIAYQSTILMARADDPGSCGSSGGCSFSDSAISAGINLAVANGAKVINISLGGSGADAGVQRAVANAAAAGAVIVIAAGNGGDANPDTFAATLRQAGGGAVIIAGSVNGQGTMSGFSNRAGSEASWYLAALGEQVCCVYENGQIRTTMDSSGQTFITVVSGTSFAAPQIAGAAVLLRQAFPNLTAQQVVDLLLSSATDAGTTGLDSLYGRGILNIANAFSAHGATTVAGTATVLVPTDGSLITPASMGDAVQAMALHTTVLDSYQRAYAVDLRGSTRSAPVTLRLGRALLDAGQPVAIARGGMALDFTTAAVGPGRAWAGPLRLSHDEATAARVLAGRIVARIAPGMNAGFAFAGDSDGLAAQLRGMSGGSFLIAPGAAADFGFARRDLVASAVRFGRGRAGLTVSADAGRLVSDAPEVGLRTARGEPRVARFGVTLDRRFGGLGTSLGAHWLAEDRSVLGARLAAAFDPRGADSLFIDAAAAWQPAGNWQLSAAYRRGMTRARPGATLTTGSRLASSAWNVDLVRHGVFTGDDSVALRLAQPLRVDHGGLRMRLPTAWDYATLSATSTVQQVNLAPSGREIDAELGWSGRFGRGSAGATLFWRRDPGHLRAGSDDRGVAARWSLSF